MKNEVRPIDANELVNSLKNRRLHILLENENDGAGVFDDIIDWIKYTPDICASPAGGPLTLEQLRKKDGQPVWVKCLNLKKYISPPAGWRILEKSITGHFGVWDGENCLAEKDYGVDWLAYAYHPAHIDREAWVSVEERLPDDNERVIVYRPNEAEVSAYKYCVMWGWSVKMSMKRRGISHWMPFPEPPTDLEKRMGVRV